MIDWLKEKSPLGQIIAVVLLLAAALVILKIVLAIVNALIPLLVLAAIIGGIYWFVTQYNKD